MVIKWTKKACFSLFSGFLLLSKFCKHDLDSVSLPDYGPAALGIFHIGGCTKRSGGVLL